MLYTPKQDLYDLLSTVENVVVYQNRPEKLKEFPCICFSLTNISGTLELNKEIGYQEIEVTIDVFAKSSGETSSLLASLDEKLRTVGWILNTANDVPDPDGYSHITTTYKLTI